jgi:hypothetical protein
LPKPKGTCEQAGRKKPMAGHTFTADRVALNTCMFAIDRGSRHCRVGLLSRAVSL